MHRQLGANERITWSYQQLRPMHFSVVGTIIGEILPSELKRALEKAQQKHLLLGVKVGLDEARNPWFTEGSAKIPVRVIKREDSKQWRKEIEEELSRPFNTGEAPLIRVSLIQGECICELILTCDHTIGDGKSVLFLLRDILQYIGTPDQPVIVLPPRQSYEKILQGGESETAYPSEKLSQMKIKPKFPENSRPNLYAWLLDESETKTIINRCKKEGITVHAGICAAFLLSIAESQPTKKILKCLTPVNIRAALPGVEDDFGYYFTTVNTEHPLTPNLSIWDLSRSVKSQIDEAITPAKNFAHLPGLETFLSTSPDHEKAVNMIDLVNEHDIIVTNLGKLDIPEKYGQLELVAVYGPSLMTHIDQDLILGVMTFRGRMSLTLTFSGSCFAASQIQRLQEKAMDLLGVTSCQKSLTS
jgi:NRPS condensation-like uncharacterized protein